MLPVASRADPLADVERARGLLRERPCTSRAVHEARRSLRRARSVLALAGGGEAEKGVQRARDSCRRAARVLAPLRDARVFSSALEKLLARGCGELSDEAVASGHAAASRARLEEGRVLAEGGVVRRASEALRRCPRRLAAASAKSVENGLRRAYRRCRREYRVARETATGEAFHDLRKSAKRLLHELEWLGPTRRSAPAAALDGLRDLVKVLGREHDLTVIRENLERIPCAAARDPLSRLARRRQRRLRRRALSLARKSLERRTGDFSATLRRAA